MYRLEEVKKNIREQKKWNEQNENTIIEYTVIVFMVIFRGMLNISPNSSNQQEYISRFNVGNFPKNEIGNIRGKLIQEEPITSRQSERLHKLLIAYFENKNNNLYDIQRVALGVKQLEELKCLQIELENWNDDIEKWNAKSIGECIVKIWDSTYEKYLIYIKNKNENNIKIETLVIDTNELKKLQKEEGRYHLKVDTYTLKSFTEEVNRKRGTNIDELKSMVEFVFNNFLEEYCNSEKLKELSEEEYNVLLEAVYSSADIFDKIHHDRSYTIQIELLDSVNRRYSDDYNKVNIEIARKVIGLIYGIAICPRKEQDNGPCVGLTGNENLIKKKIRLQTSIDRLDCYIKAMHSIAKVDCLKIGIDEDLEYNLMEDKQYKNIMKILKKSKGDCTNNCASELNRLEVWGMFFSDLAAIHMNYLISDKNPKGIDWKEHFNKAKNYHMTALTVRSLLANIYNENNDENIWNEKIEKCKLGVAKSVSNIASLAYKANEHGKCIALRKGLFEFYQKNGYKNLRLNEARYICNSMSRLKEQYKDNERDIKSVILSGISQCRKEMEGKNDYILLDGLSDDKDIMDFIDMCEKINL